MSTTSARLIDNIPIVINEMATSYGELRMHAELTSRLSPSAPERGMAEAILWLVDEIEQREQERVSRP